MSRSPLRSPWVLAVLALAALHMLVFDRGLGGDGWAPFAVLESLADDGDLDLANNGRGVLNGLVRDASGRLVMQYPPGILVLDALPFFAGRMLDKALPAGVLAHGAQLPPVGRVPRAVFLSAALIVLARNIATLVGLAAISAALGRLGVGAKRTAAVLAFTFFGGPLIFYSLVGMTHAPVFGLAGLLLLVLVRARGGAPAAAVRAPVGERQTGATSVPSFPGRGEAVPSSAPEGKRPVAAAGAPSFPVRKEGRAERSERGGAAFLAGLLVGGATLVRYGSIALAAPALAALLPGNATSRWRRALSFAAGAALPLLLIPLWWRINFGSLRPPYGGDWVFTLASPWNVLFSPRHGLFLFHPALLLAALGLAVGVAREARRRDWGWGAIGSLWFLAVAALYGCWSEWANPGGYGQRFLIDALPAAALGFAWFLEGGRARGLRLALAGATTLFGFVLFFASVGGLVPPAPGLPWPLRIGEYSVLLRDPPGPARLADGLRRSSFLLRGLLGPAPADTLSP